MHYKTSFWPKITVLVLFLVSTVLVFGKDSPSDSKRSKININREWKFQLGDYQGADKINFADIGWQDVGLPHSFSLPYFLSSDFYTGYGWYRKHLSIKDNSNNRQFSLEFEGVFQVAEVYVNGVFAGTHRGGYNGFSIDITKAVHPGDNLIAVRVNNIWNPQLAPRAGEHVFSGGIYRDVWLVETAPMHVAWYGTFVTTPELSEKSGKVNVKTEVQNGENQDLKGLLITTILDPGGNKITAMQSPFEVDRGKTIIIDQTSQTINNPKLWSPTNPVLYKSVTTIKAGDKIVDTYETSFGMRWVKWTADQGFFINGNHYYLKGCNVHQDHAGWGDAVTNSAFERDVQLIKEAGFNFIRGSHYPHDPAFSDACDKAGMLFWSENCYWGIGGFKPEGNWSCSAYPTMEKDEKGFENSLKESLKEMIRIHRNHPSIIIWSMCNEPFFTAPETMPKVRALLKDLVSYSHELDPSRSAAIGGCQRGDIDKIGDVAGYNGDGAKLFMNPGVASVVCEYGSTIADRPGEYIPGYGDLQEEQFSWRSGQAIWCGFDHGSVGGHFGCMGLFDYFRLPKRQWYWYRNEYKKIAPPEWPKEGIPAAIRLNADKTIIEHADGTDDIHLIATITDKDGNALSNCPDVKFEIVSGPGEFPTGSSILFQKDSDIVIRDGKSAIEFRSYFAGSTVIRATSPGLSADEITIVSKGAPVFKSSKNSIISRPYIRYVSKGKKDNEEVPINLLAERPTKTSSSNDKHSSRLANDLNLLTYWEADEKSEQTAWWQVDMENIYTLSKIELTFKEEMMAQFTIEISMDGKSWNKIADQTNNVTLNKSITEIPSANHGRFLRINFIKMPNGIVPNISNIVAFGEHKN
jgi:beta-galactosidase